MATGHPVVAGALALGLGAAGTARLFGRSTFRRKPFRPHKPLPGRFSHERVMDFERRRSLEAGPRPAGWRSGYLGDRPWAWVRAAIHETHGAVGWKGFLRGVSKMWGLGLVLFVYTWLDRGEYSFGEAFGRMLYDALLRSPHQGPIGEKNGPYLLVMIVIAAVGIVTAMFNAVALGDASSYSLSRLQRARVAFRAGLVDMAFFVAFLGLGLFLIAHLSGLLVGYELRFDFMPFHFRALLVTLVLMPLGHWGRLRLREAARRRAENTVVAVAFSVVGFVTLVAICVFVLPVLTPRPAAELAVLIVALALSQLAYRQSLLSYYRTADLA